MRTTPKKEGYRFPAEWEQHEATWLSWPHNEKTWLNTETNENLVERIEEIYVQEIKALHEAERVNILVNSSDEEKKVRKLLQKEVDLKQIYFFHIPTVDVWIRDYGPLFVVNDDKKRLAMLHCRFDAWGGKYTRDQYPDDPTSWLADDASIPREINKYLRIRRFVRDFTLEGGSIDCNGKGTLLTTKQCLLRTNYFGNKRNPHLNKTQITTFLKEHHNLSHIIWLDEGILGDDTDGHVDDLARFVNPTTVVYCREERRRSGNYAVLKENQEILENAVDQNGNKLNLIPLPMPAAVQNPNADPKRPETKQLPLSYANFYIGNAAVLLPVFGDKKKDSQVTWTLQQLFPDRKVVPLYARDFVLGFGTFHCSTQQQPLV